MHDDLNATINTFHNDCKTCIYKGVGKDASDNAYCFVYKHSDNVYENSGKPYGILLGKEHCKYYKKSLI